MNLTKFLRIAAAVSLVTMGFATPSHAAATAFFSAGNGCTGASSASFSPGGANVQVSLCMTTTAPTATCGHTFVLQSAVGEGGRFVVVSPFTLGSNYNDANSEVSALPLAINNPPTIVDLGGTGSAPVAATANQLLATFNLAPQASATNTSYVISLNAVSSVAVDADGTCGATTVPTELPITASFTLNRSAAPAFTSASSATFSTASANTFTVTATGIPTPTITAGTLPAGVSFVSGGTNSGTGTLSTASGAFTPGTITFTATSGAATQTQTFTLLAAAGASQTINFTNPVAQTFSSTPVPLVATATSGLTVSFTSSTPTVCAISGGTNVSMLTVGTCTINANQAGNATFAAAPQVTRSFGISGTAPGAPTIGVATPGNAQATIAFTAPTSTGGQSIRSYQMSCVGASSSVTATGTVSPITVFGLTNGVTYTCSVTATNDLGSGAASATVAVTPSSGVTPNVVGVVSRKLHTVATVPTPFDLPIDFTVAATGLVSVEPRVISTGHNVVFLLNAPITVAGTASAKIAGTATDVGTIGTVTFVPGSSEVVVPITGIPDNTRVTVTLTGVNGITQSVTLGFLVGDVNSSRVTNGTDVIAMKTRTGQSVDAFNFRFDINLSGVINGTDVIAAKTRAGFTLP